MKIRFVKKFLVVFFVILILFSFLTPFSNANNLEIYSPSALLMDFTTGKILYDKNMDEKRYPASLTKVMTAIIVLENCDLKDIVTISYDAVMSLSSGYVTANLQIGEKFTVEQLLYVLMIGSSNDAALALAEHISGSVEEFSKLMNKKAKELGCNSTNFVNPNGVHDKNHYSTAYDLAIIAKYAMNNELFRTIVSTTSYRLPATDKYKREDRLFTTTNQLLMLNNNSRNDNYYYKYATGIKTGFTTPAGNCLVASANKNGLQLIAVVLGSGQTKSGLSARYIDTINLFDYGYDNYILKEVIKSGGVVQTTNVSNATRDTKKLEAVVQNDVSVLIKQSDKDSAILPKVNLNDNLKAPIKKGEVIGSVTYTIEGIDYTQNLLASNDVKKSKALIRTLEVVFILFLCWLYLKAKQRQRKNKRLRKRASK